MENDLGRAHGAYARKGKCMQGFVLKTDEKRPL